MNLILKSLRLYAAGVYLRVYKYLFDRATYRKINAGKDITDRRINNMSKKYFRLSEKFNRLEINFLDAAAKYNKM